MNPLLLGVRFPKTPFIGQRIGRWMIFSDLGMVMDKVAKKRKVSVKCECGNIRDHFYSVLKAGLSTSCGCYRADTQGKRRKEKAKHNLSKHPLYQIWRGMKARCYNKNDKAYSDYGLRGICVCAEWRNDFKAFYDWAINNGWEFGLVNDRRDNDGGYSPKNCRFVTDAVSVRNTRRNVNMTFNGETKCITDWATDIGLSTQGLSKRIKNGWSIEKALTTKKL